MARILIADDDTISRDLLKMNLEDEGHEVIMASNGAEALSLTRTMSPDLVIADVMMPEMDGFVFCRQCKTDPQLKHIPIILCSSTYTDPHEQQLGYQFGADRYLLKPVIPDTLGAMITTLLSQRQQTDTDEHRALLEDDMKLLESYNRVLFDKLVKKMSELQKQVEAHRKTEEALISTQSQLLQNEKMATIGQMAAGVAHEINNPLAFITSNLSSLQGYLGRFQSYFTAVEQAMTNHQDQKTRQEIEELRRRLKLDYVFNDVPKLIGDCLEGADRLKNIALDLRSFSRADQVEKTFADLGEVARTAINIAHNELKQVANVDQQFAEIPEVLCYPQQLGQVLLNLLINAAQAMEQHGTITVRTWSEGQQVFIEVQDTGCGMTPEVQARIFDPFFTTKPAGKGTGLGLPISFEIVRRHHGAMTVKSEPGKGTTFRISLPVNR